MKPSILSNYAFGGVMVVLIVLQALREWADVTVDGSIEIAIVLAVMLMVARAGRTGRIFVAVGILLTLATILTRSDWQEPVRAALLTSGFFAAFFSALSLLRTVAQSSPAMEAAGTYLALQPPGRRYLALSAGSNVFSLVLNYGAIQLLAALALASSRNEPDDKVRVIRTRRMLLAIQRGFVASMAWSPLSFTTAIAASVIPGTSWAQLALPGVVSGLLLLGSGWAIDTIFKPRSTGAPTAAAPAAAGSWRSLLPLGLLLAVMMTAVISIELVLGLRVIAIVLVIVPVISLTWMRLQSGGTRLFLRRVETYVLDELNGFRHEILLILSAAYIGIIAAALLAPIMEASDIDLGAVPAWVLMLAVMWAMPVLGQIGANPILSMSLIGPLLPPAAALGVSPTALAMSMVCGWMLTGINSPFTATTLLIARFGGITPLQVGWDREWNRGFFFTCVGLLSAWTLIHAALSA